MPEIAIRSMAGHPEWIAPCAAWWLGQWGVGMGFSAETAPAAIEALTEPDGRQAALIALVDGVPAGSVFLVENDLDTHAHLAPWLAGLFVLPEFRHIGLGQRLVTAVVAAAATLGYERLYLYTSIGQYYRRQGWEMHPTLMFHDTPHEVMTFVLGKEN